MVLTTERLELHPLTLEDATDIFAIFSDVRAMRFMPYPVHQNIDETRSMIENSLQTEGAMYWTVRLKGDSRVIGQVNYLGGTRVPGLGYITHPDVWGQGITVEACRVALDYGFENIGYNRVELWIDERNVQSLRVAQKLGFGLKGRIPHHYAHHSMHHYMQVWGILQSEWNTDNQSSEKQVLDFFATEPAFLVRNVEASVEFYRDKLGFNLDFLYGDPPNHAGVSRGLWSGSMVSIQLAQASSKRDIIPSAYLHVRVSDVNQLYEQYRVLDVPIVAEPDNKPWGFREFTIKDPDGHMLVLASWA